MILIEENNSSVFAKRVELLMRRQDLSNQNMADKLNMDYSSFWRRIKGKRTVDMNLLIRLAEVLGTSVAYLIGETDNPNRGIDAFSIDGANTQHAEIEAPENRNVNYPYWVGVINEVRDVVERGNKNEISSVAQFFKVAYDMLSSVCSTVRQTNILPRTLITDSSTYGGHHNRNGMTVKANA